MGLDVKFSSSVEQYVIAYLAILCPQAGYTLGMSLMEMGKYIRNQS